MRSVGGNLVDKQVVANHERFGRKLLSLSKGKCSQSGLPVGASTVCPGDAVGPAAFEARCDLKPTRKPVRFCSRWKVLAKRGFGRYVS